MTIRHCKNEGCHHLFVTKTHNKVFCNDLCAKQAKTRRLHPGRNVPCRLCNRPMHLEGRGAHRRSCSKECRQVHHAMRHYKVKGIPLAIRAMLNLTACQACGRTFLTNSRMYQRCIDHDHETGYFRGIICGICNVTAGTMTPKQMRDLANYVESRTPANEMSGYIVSTAE